MRVKQTITIESNTKYSFWIQRKQISSLIEVGKKKEIHLCLGAPSEKLNVTFLARSRHGYHVAQTQRAPSLFTCVFCLCACAFVSSALLGCAKQED